MYHLCFLVISFGTIHQLYDYECSPYGYVVLVLIMPGLHFCSLIL